MGGGDHVRLTELGSVGGRKTDQVENLLPGLGAEPIKVMRSEKAKAQGILLRVQEYCWLGESPSIGSLGPRALQALRVASRSLAVNKPASGKPH